jgi:hypothetical protein
MKFQIYIVLWLESVWRFELQLEINSVQTSLIRWYVWNVLKRNVIVTGLNFILIG